MTIVSTNNRNDYVGNGATAVYSYTFKIFAITDLKVTKRDLVNVETVLTIGTDYTVSGAGDPSGGSITLTAGSLPSGYRITIRRLRTLTQNTDIRNQGSFYPETHEDTFDILTMVDQQQQNELDRSLKLPETVTGVSVQIPVPAALKWMRWDAAGTALENMDAAALTGVSTIGAGLQLLSGDLSIVTPVLQGVAAGTVDAITASIIPAPAALVNNLRVLVEASGANTSATPTLTLNALAAKTIVKGSNMALDIGDIPGADYRMDLCFDASLDKWVLLNPYGHLGAWDATKVKDTVYQAATDVMVYAVADFTGAGASGTVTATTDASNPPTTVIGKYGPSSQIFNSFSFPCKKGHYWKVALTTTGGTPVVTLNVIPIGT